MILHHTPTVVSPLSLWNETMIAVCCADNQKSPAYPNAGYAKLLSSKRLFRHIGFMSKPVQVWA